MRSTASAPDFKLKIYVEHDVREWWRIQPGVKILVFAVVFILLSMGKGESLKANRLDNSSSPYLLQHAGNPVNWFPWGNEAFETAVREDKPVFLSIGYSTCHWCHVMERESFEDADVARLMNDTFVSIKVDREERPDLDHVYMQVCQAMTGSGGWPLTVLLTPDRKPFFAGTYFPKTSRYGRIGMMDLIPRIRSAWQDDRTSLVTSANRIVSAMDDSGKSQSGSGITDNDQDRAFRDLQRQFDSRFGGFSGAPKFPMPSQILFLLRYWRRTGEPAALEMVEMTLQSMRCGGIYDQLGFGFHRYSTDAEWLVPHFEKMLYDQALLSLAYIEAYQATKNPFYLGVAREVFDYVLENMTAPGGGFYSAEDADSDGVEGLFYLWSMADLRSVLTDSEVRLVRTVFNVKDRGNFQGEMEGMNILHLKQFPLKDDSQGESGKQIDIIRAKLLNHRNTRVRPFRDEKILTDWNGLMIAALARGGIFLDDPTYIHAAEKAADFLLKHLRKPDGSLQHSFFKGSTGVQGHLDDYAFLGWGLLELYEVTFDPAYLKTSMILSAAGKDRFGDPKSGGYFFTQDNKDTPFKRWKDIQDGVIPSGNAVAVQNLLKLNRMTTVTGKDDFSDISLQSFSNRVASYPAGFTFLLTVADMNRGPSTEIIIAGTWESDEANQLIDGLREVYIPDATVLFVPCNEPDSLLFQLVPTAKQYLSTDGATRVFVCRNAVCEQPVTSLNKLGELLLDSP
jgi:uncharacterized protein